MAQFVPTDTIHFPTLSKLNAGLFDWNPGKENILAANNSLYIKLEIFASILNPRPPPTPVPAPGTPLVPAIGDLTVQLMASADKLFFISHKIPGSTNTEWHLAQVDLKITLEEHPTAFLVNF